jgi:SagB-type dehydrogenase family enzyme
MRPAISSRHNAGTLRPTVAEASQLEVVMRYHERTKHHFNRFAPGPGGLDWANQPDPFRRYAEAPLTRLPILKDDEEPLSPRYDSLYAPGAVASVPMSVRALSRLLEYALALSAWKQAGGARWALRANPSSGNLHPTEGYVLIGGIAELGGTPGLFHYAPAEHGLERRADCPPALFARLTRGLAAGGFLVGMSSVYWREAWKYGERAFRYCQHDAGHAIGTLRIAAATLGWSARVLEGVADATLEALLGLDRNADFEGAERESAELLMGVWPGSTATTIPDLELDAVRVLAKQRWYGKANRLSPEDPVPWEVIDTVSAASRKP